MEAIYRISALDYLSRAREQLAAGRPDNLFYAALELRCCLESRMQQYLEVWDHIPRSRRKDWSIAKLGRSITQYFQLDEKIARLDLCGDLNGISIGIFYHTPIPINIRKNGEILGSYLHAQHVASTSDAAWWSSFKDVLHQTASALDVSTKGTLLGPPLIKRGTNIMTLCAELPPGKEDITHKLFRGARHSMHIDYIDRLPCPLEENAVAW